MQRTVFFKKFLMPCGLCAAIPAMKPNTPVEEHATHCTNETDPKKLMKPSELPIYSVEDGYSKEIQWVGYTKVEEEIRQTRQTLTQIRNTWNKVYDDVSNTFENLKFVVDYLQDDNNLMPRIGAVGIGGFSGLILGLRGGMLKRLFYTTTGASIVGCILFPREAKEAFHAVEHYGNISYNFIYGVKPGDSQKEISFNDLPLLKTIRESEYFHMLTRHFEQKPSDTTTGTVEGSPSTKKSEKDKE